MNKENPKISVVMSVYNGSCYLRESIESILNQTFTNFEFIIINDCSTDNSWEIINEYAKKDLRIILINNQENIGLTKSLNKGLKIAKGEYIARQDADDISLPDRLLIQTSFLDTHLEVGAIGSDAEAIDDKGEFIGNRHLPFENNNKGLIEHEKLQAYLLINNCLYHSSLIARKNLVNQLGGYQEDLRYAQDYDLWWRLSLLSRLASLSDILIRVRYSTNNITSKKRQEQLLCSLRISQTAVKENLQNQLLNEKAYHRFWWAYLKLLDRESYQRFWLDRYGQDALLQNKDIAKLLPFWNFLKTFPGGSQVWSPRLRELANDFLRQRQIFLGLHLLWVVVHHFNTSIEWGTTIKALVKAYVPNLGQKFWVAWKLKQIES